MSSVSQRLRSSKETGKSFIGRVNEQECFIQHALAADIPAYQMFTISGRAGIGKSALLARFHELVSTTEQPYRCFTAFVEVRWMTPAHIMEECAHQLRLQGAPLTAFEDTLTSYKAASYQRLDEQAFLRTAYLRQQQLLGQEATSGPVIGRLYEAVAQAARSAFNVFPQAWASTEKFRDRALTELVQAFVSDLNWLIAGPEAEKSSAADCRVILFFDLWEVAASETLELLFSLLRQTSLSKQIVLVVASRDPLAGSEEERQSRYNLDLAELNEEETGNYLARYGITEAEQIAMLWRISRGLPLALKIFAACPPEKLKKVSGPETEALTYVLPEFMRGVAGDHDLGWKVALFSRPFAHTDLHALRSLSAQDHVSYYRWLLSLPFIECRTIDGKHRYCDPVQRVLRQSLLERSFQAVVVTSRELAQHYQREIELLEASGKKGSAAWLEAVLAHIYQLLCMPDAVGYCSAIEQVIMLGTEADQRSVLIPMLHQFARDASLLRIDGRTQSSVEQLLRYFEVGTDLQGAREAVDALIAMVADLPAKPVSLIAQMYRRRGLLSLALSEPDQANDDFSKALTLEQDVAYGHALRGLAQTIVHQNQRAVEDFTRALRLTPENVWLYVHRAMAYLHLGAYERALNDVAHAALLDPDLPYLYTLRNRIYWQWNMKGYRLGSFDYSIEEDPQDAQAYVMRGMALCSLGKLEQALASFNRALALEENNAQAYAGRGHAYLEQGKLEEARADFAQAWKLNPSDLSSGLMEQWTILCQRGPVAECAAQLERLAEYDRQHSLALLCRGVALLLHKRYAEALAVLEQSLAQEPEQVEALFWLAMIHAYLEQEQQAMEALMRVQTFMHPLPEVLLLPLRWLELERPNFYRLYTTSLPVPT
ncbi:tetratricopeptide repeat protein [Ktedonosporobacter rubrisoli]|nr:tetratricopeptide repeat protein [Ktedonosporobacter rubrisoli]